MALWMMVMFLGFMVHFLLVLGTNRLCGLPTDRKGAVLAGLLGGMQAGGSMLSGFGFLADTHWRIIVLVLSAWVAFSRDGALVRRGGFYLLLHLSVGHIVSGELWAFLLAAVLICALCRIGLAETGCAQRYADVTIQYKNQTLHLRALRDTGNVLRDPISGEGVLVVDRDMARSLLGIEPMALARPWEILTSCDLPGLRLIPYHSVGKTAGLLLGLRVDRILVDGVDKKLILAFAPDQLGDGKTFQALAGGMI